MTEDNGKNIKDVLRQAQEALKASAEQARRVDERKAKGPSHEELAGDAVTFKTAVIDLSRRFAAMAGTAYHTLETGKYIYDSWVSPVWERVRPAASACWRGYKAAFNRVAHYKDQNGSLIFSKKRAAGAALASLILVGGVVNYAVPLAIHTVYDAGMLLTLREDDIYLNKAQEIDPVNGVHQTSGCYKYPCNPDETKYFRLRDNVILDIRNIFTRGHAYYPEDVAGTIANETNYCHVKYYGWRNKTLDWYPYIIDAQCTPVSISPR